MTSASPSPETPLVNSPELDISSSHDLPQPLDSHQPESQPESQPEDQPKDQQKDQSTAKWQVFASTFLTIFLAEMGDKTQIATLLMTAESHAPWVIFLGASTALFMTSLVGVLLGRWLASRLSPQTLDRSAAIMLLGVAGMLFWEVWQG
jgi:Ca2+/H+ antiporter, TMEM165/GDT1 family